MPWPDLFGRRRLDDAVRAMESMVTEVRAASEEARAAAQVAEKSAAEVTALDATKLNPAPTRRHITLLTLLCLAAIGLGAVVTVNALSSFSDPIALSFNSGTVDLLIRTDVKDERSALGLGDYYPAYISADYDQPDQSVVYDVLLPAQLAGRSFAFVLTGSAVLEDVTGDGTTTFSSDACADEPVYASADDHACQIITGVISPAHAEYVYYSCLPPEQIPKERVRIEIRGSTHMESSTDWAHHMIDLPQIGAVAASLDPISKWRGQDLGGSYGTPGNRPCRSLQLFPGDTVTSLSRNSQPTAGPVNSLQWDSSGSLGSMTVVTRTQHAGAVGNGLLAFGAAVVALGLGFIPVVYQQRIERNNALQATAAHAPPHRQSR